MPSKNFQSAPLVNGQKAGVLRFGIFELELESRELRKGGRLLKLQSQHSQLLTLLAEHAGRVVSREEIQQALWSGETFVDFDRSINFAINQIRVALDDDPRSPRYIETLPRKGYRFIAPVSAADQGNDRAVDVTRSPRWLLLSIGTLALIVLVASNIGGLRSRLFPRPAPKSIESLAVLPLENLSHDAEQEYFADGMTDELITALAKISALRVISRTSVMQYKGTKKPIAQIARELNVDSVLEGTVTRDQHRFRITAQLIRTEPERHIWAEQYEGDLSEVLTLQDNVANAVARAIQVKVTPQERVLLAAPRAVNPEAYEDYLKGLWAGKPGSSVEENISRSREYFTRAIEKDPGYALAWAGLADAFKNLSNWGVLPSQDALPRARAAAERALQLDNSLVGPLVTLALVKMNYEWDWAGAERLLKRAIELSPNDGEAHHIYATFLAEVGRTEEAVAEARRAYEAEPLSMGYHANVAWKLYLARRYDEAELENRRVMEVYPRFNGNYLLASIYLQTGRQREAVAILRESVERSKHSVLELMYLGHALGVTGDRDGGRQVLKEMLQMSQRRNVPPEYIAIVYEGIGERDHALEWFERAYKERSMNGWILPDPALDSIRSDARFKDIMRRMGLPR